jgi:hypothetical protein
MKSAIEKFEGDCAPSQLRRFGLRFGLMRRFGLPPSFRLVSVCDARFSRGSIFSLAAARYWLQFLSCIKGADRLVLETQPILVLLPKPFARPENPPDPRSCPIPEPTRLVRTRKTRTRRAPTQP